MESERKREKEEQNEEDLPSILDWLRITRCWICKWWCSRFSAELQQDFTVGWSLDIGCCYDSLLEPVMGVCLGGKRNLIFLFGIGIRIGKFKKYA